MTREEAWRRTKGYLYDVLSGEEADEIIKALEQQPCDDCISRQAVDTLVDELARAISDERCCISRGRSTATIMQDILDLPPVKPQERPTGHWIDNNNGTISCSYCHTWFNKDNRYYYMRRCPYCGTKNGESEEV